MTPSYDPELAPTLEGFHEMLGIPKSMTPEWISEMSRRPHDPPVMPEILAERGAEERRIPGPVRGSTIAVTILRPRGEASSPLPGMLFIHGGGMIGGSRYDGLDQTLDWIDAVPMVVVSVEYRLAPTHPHPAPIDDCFAALQWMSSAAEQLGIDPNRLAVSGASAGGGLAAACALRARDEGMPSLRAQLLIYPMLDDRPRHASSVAFVGVGVHDSISNASCWAALLGDVDGAEAVSPYAAPARAESLRGLPPTYIDVGALETFRDEDVDYAQRIWLADGDAELHVWPRAFHGFDAIVPTAAISRAARAARVDWLRRVLD